MSKFLSACGALVFSFLLACSGGGSSSDGGNNNPSTPAAVAPSITAQPQSAAAVAGDTATFSVTATGTAPLSYQWKKGTTNVGTNAATLTLTNVQAADAGSYAVTVSNSAGDATSDAATLTVTASAVAPNITAQPQSTSAVAGDTATFSVTATGTAPLSYQWKKGTTNVGTNSATLTLTNVQAADAGSYAVTVSNSAGNATSDAATLTVTASAVAPTITAQPQSTSVPAGDAATFSVTATGTAPLSYQWKKGTTNVGTNAATLTLTNVQAADAGSYAVTVSNSVGNATSSAAILTVTAAPSMNYLYAYNSDPAQGTTGLVNKYIREAWEDPEGSLATNLTAASPGRAGQIAEEVTFGADNGWNGIGFARRKSDWTELYPLFLNQFRTIEFDIQFASNSTGEENLEFVFEDSGYSDGPSLTSFIPGWSSMTSAQKRGNWFHVAIDLASIHPAIPSFSRFLFFNGADGDASQRPHFYLADVKLGWVADATAPVISFGSATLNLTYDQLALAFTTNEACRYKIDYGTSTSYGHTVQGGSTDDDFAKIFAVNLTGLTPGSTCYYRITAIDHQFLNTDTANQGTYTGSIPVPAAPTTPPTISNLAASNVDGCSATLIWTTDRPCSAAVTYQKSGGSLMTRGLSDFTSSRAFLLDLLEPSTTYTVKVTVTDAFGNVSATQTITVNTTTGGTADVTVTINPAQTKAISPYVYGLNFSDGIDDAPEGVTFNRSGGNRWTAYNWENNASNAGSDWGPFSNDGYLGGGNTPAEAVRGVIASDRSRNQASLVTLQLQGYVSADEDGLVDISDPNHLAERFKQVVFKKGSAFTTTPSTSDAYVYMDEFAWTLDQKIPGIFNAGAAIPTFISLDNEPELWPTTHEEIQGGDPMSSDDYIARTIDLCKALKDQFPDVQLFGPVNYGFNGLVNWQGEMNSTLDGNDWFPNKYLEALQAASAIYGSRLLDVYDFHWYSEACSTDTETRVANLLGTTLSAAEVQAVVQSPRSLWDSTYTEYSWVADWMGAPVNILGRLQAKIDHSWPGTKIAITEYESGGDNHIAGAVAQADNLGVFGDVGVFAANWWPPNSTYPYTVGAFRAFRGFDGASANYGDTALKTTSSNIEKVSVHASTDSAVPGRTVFVAINRSTAVQKVALNGQTLSGTATVYRITAESGAAQVSAGTPVKPVLVGQVPVSGSSFLIALPAMSVSTIEVE